MESKAKELDEEANKQELDAVIARTQERQEEIDQKQEAIRQNQINQNNAARAQIASAYLMSHPVQPYQLPMPTRPVQCTTNRVGTMAYTTCN